MKTIKPQIVTTDSSEVRAALLEGTKVLSDAVSTTLGPLGSNVIIETPYGPTTVTKDGVTVSDQIALENPIQNLAVDVVKQAASKTSKTAGDGTTTSTLLSYALFKEAYPLLLSSTPPISIKRTFEDLLSKTLDYLSSISKPITLSNIKDIATISANNDHELGSLISDAYNHVSLSGIIALEDSPTPSTTIELIDGAHFDRGFVSHYFITDPKTLTAEYENPLFLITDYKIRSTQEIAPLLEKVAPTSRPLIIIADEIEGQVLSVLIYNKLHGRLKSLAVKAPSFAQSRQDILQDLAALTSSNFISHTKGQRLEDVTLNDLGTAAKITSTETRTTIFEPARDEEQILARTEAIHAQLQTATGYEKEKLESRLANLSAKIALLKVGASTETELKEKKDRLDDALKATRAAIQKGYLPGGGTALLRAASQISPSDPLQLAFTRALTYPFYKILNNASLPSEVIKDKVLSNPSTAYGYDVSTNTFGDLEELGVIDPTLVVTEALRNATSAASMLILSSTAVHAIDRTPPYNPHDHI